MHGLLDDLLVGLVLLAAVLYATYALGPKALRRRGLAAAGALLARLPVMGLRGVATRLAQAAAKSRGACGGCDTCGSDQPAPATTPDVLIPLSKIGKRQ